MFFLNIHRVGVQRWHGWCHKKLLPSRRVLCTPYNHAPCHFMQSHIRKVYACLAVACHLHFWQHDRGLLRATAVTRGWNGYRNKSQHIKLTLEKKISRRSNRDSNPRPFDHEFGALTTELSPPPVEPRIAKQCKCHHCCSCKNCQGKGMEDGKKGLCVVFWLTRRSRVRRIMRFGASYSTSNKL